MDENDQVSWKLDGKAQRHDSSIAILSKGSKCETGGRNTELRESVTDVSGLYCIAWKEARKNTKASSG